MSEAAFWVTLAGLIIAAAVLIYVLLPAVDDDEPTEHGDGEQ